MKRAALPFPDGLACTALLTCHTGLGGHLSESEEDTIRRMDQASRRVGD